MEVVNELRMSNPQIADATVDLLKWRQGTHYGNLQGLIDALGLKRDPSRSQTHIVLRRIAHVPGSHANTDYRLRVRVTHCTVYRINDILEDLPKVLPGPRKTKEEIHALIRHVLREFMRTARGAYPMLHFTIGPHISVNLNACEYHSHCLFGPV